MEAVEQDVVVETPMLFIPRLAKAIREGKKTRTVRPLPAQPGEEWTHVLEAPDKRAFFFADRDMAIHKGAQALRLKSPWGKAGDKIWVRETHAIVPKKAWNLVDGKWRLTNDGVILRADSIEPFTECPKKHPHEAICGCNYNGKWTPSLHMKRVHCKAVLTIMAITVKRIQSFTEEEAASEGNQPLEIDGKTSFLNAFMRTWQDLYFKTRYNWVLNPWVASIQFALDGRAA